MRAVVLLALALVACHAVPAVYYNLWFVMDDTVSTVDASGSSFATLYKTPSRLAGSIAYNGSHVYVVEGGDAVVTISATSPYPRTVVYQGAGELSCLAIGQFDGRTVLFVGSVNGTMHRMDLNGTSVTPVATFAGGDCRYLTFSRPNWLFWTTSDGRLYKYDTSRTTVDAAELVLRSGAADQGVGTVSSANLLLYVSNGTAVRSTQLDVAQNTNTNAATDVQWAIPPNYNNTRAIISLNGAVVLSTSSGISFIFSPFQPSGSQYFARQILTQYTGIRGICTDVAASLSAMGALLLVGVAFAALL